MKNLKKLLITKKVTSQQKDIGYIMKLYYRIICLEHLEKENELNDCINEMVESMIKYLMLKK